MADLGGRTDLPTLAAVLAQAACIVVGNTGPAHLAAAVGTPVVSLFAPVVPAGALAALGSAGAGAAVNQPRRAGAPAPGTAPCPGTPASRRSRRPRWRTPSTS